MQRKVKLVLKACILFRWSRYSFAYPLFKFSLWSRVNSVASFLPLTQSDVAGSERLDGVDCRRRLLCVITYGFVKTAAPLSSRSSAPAAAAAAAVAVSSNWRWMGRRAALGPRCTVARCGWDDKAASAVSQSVTLLARVSLRHGLIAASWQSRALTDSESLSRQYSVHELQIRLCENTTVLWIYITATTIATEVSEWI